jgi:hypothetical protein
MSADDTYIIRYEAGESLPFVVMWRQNYWDSAPEDIPTDPNRDDRFVSYADALRHADKCDHQFPAEYGVVVEANVPRNPAWEDNSVQFPRLLAEIYATQDSLKMADLCASMDIEVGDIVEIFERAQAEWERIKEAMT